MNIDETNILGDIIRDYCKRGGQVLFWTCPNGCRGRVEWRKVDDVHVAHCMVCGRDSIQVHRNKKIRPMDYPTTKGLNLL